ncbi:MAG: tRNA 2-thiouridine(34) synthase MnmA [Alphaproteobacteria bacterium]|nr:tRNA 2-thiouridine(34) synthase MnmA [Alphaproteobacteria bacterium]
MPNGDPKGMRIAVAMSGGVDSSVAALLLKEQGYDIVGVTLLLTPGCGKEPAYAADARRVAEALGISHRIVDAQAEFSREIVESFADTYLCGQTPLPCALCNKKIKFGRLMSEARALGAEALATGHYARRPIGAKGPELHAAAEERRDQSYFLFGLTQEQLTFARFPLSEMSGKAETRKLAEQAGLPVAQKPDSQDICFVPNGDYAATVERLRPGKILPGEIVDEKGTVLGRHRGIVHFTVGQRRGINLSARAGENNEPLFVLRLDAEHNRVVVGPREALAQRTVRLRDMNWLGDPVPAEGIQIKAKLRSAQAPVLATFRMEEGAGILALAEPVYGVAPGQAGVIYDGTRVLGGGWIEQA